MAENYEIPTPPIPSDTARPGDIQEKGEPLPTAL